MKDFLPLGLFLLLFSACSTETDDEVLLCGPPPPEHQFEVVDKTTGENLFASGVYTKYQISIRNSEGETAEYSFNESENLINVSFGFGTRSDTYTVQIGGEVLFDIVFSLEVTQGENCSATILSELRIEGITYEESTTTGITKILVTRGGAQ